MTRYGALLIEIAKPKRIKRSSFLSPPPPPPLLSPAHGKKNSFVRRVSLPRAQMHEYVTPMYGGRKRESIIQDLILGIIGSPMVALMSLFSAC